MSVYLFVKRLLHFATIHEEITVNMRGEYKQMQKQTEKK